MKTKILTIFAMAAVLMACSKNGINEPQFVSNHQLEEGEIVLKIGMRDGGNGISQGSARKIKGWVHGDNEEQNLPFQWEQTDVIRVIANGQKSTFRILTSDGQSATFYGHMPDGWEDGNDFIVEAGIDQALPPTGLNGNPVTILDDDALSSAQMKFVSVKAYQHTSEQIELQAAWSAFRLALGVDLWWTTEKDEHTSDISHKFFIKNVSILDKDDNELYKYVVNRRIAIEAASGQSAATMMLVVAPGNYDNFKVKFDFDQARCGDIYSEFNCYKDNKNTYGYPGTLTLEANEYLNAEKKPINCAIRLKNREQALTLEQWREIWPWL